MMISGDQWERGVSRRGCVIDLERFRACTSRTRFPDGPGVEAAWLDHKVVKFRISSCLRFRERLRRECFFLSNAQGGVTRLDSRRGLDGRSFFFLGTRLLTAAPSRDRCALSEAAGRSNTEEHLFGSLARSRDLQCANVTVTVVGRYQEGPMCFSTRRTSAILQSLRASWRPRP